MEMGDDASFEIFEKEVVPWLGQYVKCWPRLARQMYVLECNDRYEMHTVELKYLHQVSTAMYGALFAACPQEMQNKIDLDWFMANSKTSWRFALAAWETIKTEREAPHAAAEKYWNAIMKANPTDATWDFNIPRLAGKMLEWNNKLIELKDDRWRPLSEKSIMEAILEMMRKFRLPGSKPGETNEWGSVISNKDPADFASPLILMHKVQEWAAQEPRKLMIENLRSKQTKPATTARMANTGQQLANQAQQTEQMGDTGWGQCQPCQPSYQSSYDQYYQSNEAGSLESSSWGGAGGMTHWHQGQQCNKCVSGPVVPPGPQGSVAGSHPKTVVHTETGELCYGVEMWYWDTANGFARGRMGFNENGEWLGRPQSSMNNAKRAIVCFHCGVSNHSRNRCPFRDGKTVPLACDVCPLV
jgi:hypothetical protein